MTEPQPNQKQTFSRFADWCLHKDSLSEEARHTVEVLLEKAGTSDCYEAEKILSKYTELIFYRQSICDLNPLSSLTNLTVLRLVYNKVLDLSPLAKLTNLTELYISEKHFVDLNFLSALSNLTVLHLAHIPILDLSFISELINLTVLRLYDNQISDLSPLSGLTNLTALHLHRNQIFDLSPLSGLTNLTKLDLFGNKISSLEPIFEMKRLTRLDIASNQVSDINIISNLSNLTELFINQNKISDLSPISKLKELTRLYITCNQISDIRLLFGLKKLSSLVIQPKILESSIWSSLKIKFSRIITTQIDEQKSILAVKNVYAYMGLEEPEIIFYTTPLVHINYPCESKEWGKGLGGVIHEFMCRELSPALKFFLYRHIQNSLTQNNIATEIWSLLDKQLDDYDSLKLRQGNIKPEQLLAMIGTTKFIVQEFNYQLDQEEQKALECLNQLLENCGWIFAFEKVCIVCDRPRKISLDSNNQLHAEAEPAIQFADGWHTGYYYHGVKIPEQYGKLHFSQWQPQWLLEEDNAEVRRVLIQVIGYDRICEELQAQVLDSWQEYTLLCIDADVDVEPIHLLKMTCPSTGRIHTLRVPPGITSAREAIRWVNWDIDPENFSVQT
ncbi:leucine-rich repeat domain-containing protein [Nostoc sp. FACHB-152]|uniref:leucine-rich repeat domain-containing protein n=1 Tax=unclassified Nostoc TaxID=2593658 RepID=UPI001685AF6B|nr:MULTISPECIES: leucine-rich repeat domain-containing protein [unclassified Nostoc]MBD2449980.1 leucine-rich repeat domain-containing protein [Nostoc sp. FACHB-152]MBD2468428.1 leucine-rich repeat domain-containing protein [Nostoc sp. FACHB-145]